MFLEGLNDFHLPMGFGTEIHLMLAQSFRQNVSQQHNKPARQPLFFMSVPSTAVLKLLLKLSHYNFHKTIPI